MKNKLGLEDTKKTENPDIEILSETLKKLNDMGIDIFVGSGLASKSNSVGLPHRCISLFLVSSSPRTTEASGILGIDKSISFN